MAAIETMLTVIEGLHVEVTTLRAQAIALQQGLAQVSEDYKQRLEALSRDAAELTRIRDELRAKEKSTPVSEPATTKPPLTPDATAPEHVRPLLQVIDMAAEPVITVDPRDRRKSSFADFLLEFSNFDLENALQRVNAIVVNPDEDVGSMLEIVGWGEIWYMRSDGETMDEQLERLTTWRDALQERATYWQEELRLLAGHKNHWLWKERQSRDEAGWQAFLTNLVALQAREIERLQHEIRVLQKVQAQYTSSTGETPYV